MVRVSNAILVIFNLITLFIGLAAIGMGLYLVLGGNTACQKGLQNPLMISGAAIVVVSLLGLIGSCFRINLVLVLFLTVMFLLIVGLIAFTLFAILVTNEGASKVLSKIKVVNFQDWLRNHFVNEKNWKEIKNCLIDSKVCTSPDIVGVLDFYKKNLSPIQNGCCKPPSACGFAFQNATFWIPPKTGPAEKDLDCITWSNQQQTLCYNCESCKTGFVDVLRKEWRLLAIVNACVTLIIIFVYSIGCCAMRNNRSKTRGYNGYRVYR